ncbi:MAG TPA: GNAT family N-acetyltransferase [Rhizomicrobium sp.]|nr:GNAT family N-acetyltransferase [Rhizomicrobium sp.]
MNAKSAFRRLLTSYYSPYTDTMIPQIETERLVLRAWKAEDFEAYARFMADPEVTRYLTGEPMARNDAWRNMAMVVGHWALRGYGMWAVERKSDHAFLGRVGMWNPEGWPALEVGWTIGREYWGQGYASEAGHVALEYAFMTQDVDSMISVIDVRNMASQKVAQRLGETRGERREITHNHKTFTVDIWEISREAWRARR